MALNLQQAAIVEAIDGTVNVAAGAGTGKTFTLTERMVSCISKMSSDEDDLYCPIDRILAITFTNKAASELKSRVRNALFKKAEETKDPKFFSSALRCDDAWISTIHSMASRILKDNAIPFGISPDFKVLTSYQSEAIFAEALENVLSRLELSEDPEMKLLFNSIPVTNFGLNLHGIADMVKSIFNRTSYMPKGLDGVFIPVTDARPKDLLSKLLDVSSVIFPLLDRGEWPSTLSEKRNDYLSSLIVARDAANRWLSTHEGNSFYDESFDVSGYLDALFAFPATTDKFPTKPADFKPYFVEYRRVYKDVGMQAGSAIGSIFLKSILKIAREVFIELFAIKNAQQPLFDNNDLLIQCRAKLADPANREILQSYASQFAYIMLDEFQDTDRLQMDIITLLSDGAPCADPDTLSAEASLQNVCTVGDMQQSIYRFRGGDVELAKKRKSSLAHCPGANFELTGNYRSHKDILDAVELIFSQEEVFGENFLRLDANAPSLKPEVDIIFKDRPRVEFDYIHYNPKGGINAEAARTYAAAELASYFKQLKDEGIPAGNMAILMGSMKHANAYADALKEAGIDCLITGGSIFGSSKEAHLISYLLEYATNIDDPIPLFNILTSDLFSVTDDDLARMSLRTTSDGSVAFNSINDEFNRLSASVFFGKGRQAEREDVGEQGYSDGVIAAAKDLGAFVYRARNASATQALRDLLVGCGLLTRLCNFDGKCVDTDNLSNAANLNKAVNIVSELELQTSGIASLSKEYADYIRTIKEPPGSLSVGSSDYVSIMTIHASKGLEFDHVAVVELRDGSSYNRSFLAENIGDDTLLSLKAPRGAFGSNTSYENYKALEKFSFDDDLLTEAECISKLEDHVHLSPDETYTHLNRYSLDQELAEAQRILYVAMTRAKESLKVITSRGCKPSNTYKGIYRNVYDALVRYFGRADEGFDMNTFAVQLPIGFRRVYLEETSQNASKGSTPSRESGSLRQTTFAIPVFTPVRPRTFEPFNFSREGVFSYSSLHSDTDEALSEQAAGDGSVDNVAGAEVVAGASLAAIEEIDELPVADQDKATDLGTAFHRLAQISVIEHNAKGLPSLVIPSEDVISNQIRKCSLSDVQAQRLRRALDLWFGSALCRSFAGFGRIAAEVPFALEISCDDDQGDAAGCDVSCSASFCLEGEIDAMADDDQGNCLLIDYKTGGSAIEEHDALIAKHSLQATCYAYALLTAGYRSVRAVFVRVEQPDAKQEDSQSDPKEPQLVEYHFTQDDVHALKRRIRDAYRCTRANDGSGSLSVKR